MRITLTSITFFILYLVFSCQRSENPKIAEELLFNFPIIIDTFSYPTQEANVSSLSTANYKILYIGSPLDTIIPDYKLYFLKPLPPPPPKNKIISLQQDVDSSKVPSIPFEKPLNDYYSQWGNYENYDYWEKAKIEIKIDTSTTIKNINFNLKSGPVVNAYPVIIENLEPDTIYIGYELYLPLILEAKDSTQTWRPIEKRKIYKCGVGIGQVFLPPNEIILTSSTKTHGNYKTHLRLKIGDNYSDVFNGKINYAQFEY